MLQALALKKCHRKQLRAAAPGYVDCNATGATSAYSLCHWQKQLDKSHHHHVKMHLKSSSPVSGGPSQHTAAIRVPGGAGRSRAYGARGDRGSRSSASSCSASINRHVAVGGSSEGSASLTRARRCARPLTSSPASHRTSFACLREYCSKANAGGYGMPAVKGAAAAAVPRPAASSCLRRVTAVLAVRANDQGVDSSSCPAARSSAAYNPLPLPEPLSSSRSAAVRPAGGQSSRRHSVEHLERRCFVIDQQLPGS